ncbi:hypothetical protein DM01DRAFT_1368701 [Hesseltinella vesiculosa]|uniref:Uncharacterized protein n=1 Tax=Hesseltinella vesiculosa TaxID=101127 RepID=A0A1X2G5G5_9FUNG|nr:hypothetical protein DM01DRAFT_1368701 [Hesseltinella vesiculosa]
MITTTFLNVPKGTYMNTTTSFSDGTECDILYVPRSADLNQLPPVILEIQNVVNDVFMASAIQYCLNVYRRFHIYPILVIICVDKIASRNLADKFTPTEDMPYCLQTCSTHWAKNCFLLSKNSINTLVNGDDNQPLDPIVAFVHFLTSGQQSIIGNDHWDDPSIQMLYRIAKDIHSGGEKKENSTLNALIKICETTGSQFTKIASAILGEPKKAMKALVAVMGTSS